ncbi:MAG: hypothetical protein KC457_30975, partial [Myxococcales bacterium]|nr:hypothetical protein [Myxococcales bacterium]
RFLHTLQERELLHYSWEQECWCWDEAAIGGLPITDNVVDLVVSQLATLPADCSRALAHAACLGIEFDLRTLAGALQCSPVEAGRRLWPAVVHDLLLPLSRDYALLEAGDAVVAGHGYRFVHDRVLDGARALLSADERTEVHLHAGRALRDQADDDELFAAVGHLVEARERLDEDERTELARALLQAGRRATRAAAYDSARRLLTIGVELVTALTGDPWAREHELTLALHDALIEAAFIAGDHEAVALRAQAVIQACAEPLEQVEARVALIQSLSARLCMTEAVAESRRALDSLGVAVPSPLRMPRAMLELLAVWGKLERGGLARLTELPEAEDPLHIARCRVMSAAMLGAVSCEPPLLLLLNARTVRMALTHGMHPEVCFALAGISFILAGPMGQHRAGLKVVETAQRMVDRPGYEAVYTRVNYMARSYIAPWFEPVSKSIAALRGLVLRGRELGDIEFASLSAGVLMMQAMFVAGDLEGLLAEAMGYRRVVHKLGREMAIYVVDVYTQLIANLAGHGDETVTLTGEY